MALFADIVYHWYSGIPIGSLPKAGGDLIYRVDIKNIDPSGYRIWARAVMRYYTDSNPYTVYEVPFATPPAGLDSGEVKIFNGAIVNLLAENINFTFVSQYNDDFAGGYVDDDKVEFRLELKPPELYNEWLLVDKKAVTILTSTAEVTVGWLLVDKKAVTILTSTAEVTLDWVLVDKAVITALWAEAEVAGNAWVLVDVKTLSMKFLPPGEEEEEGGTSNLLPVLAIGGGLALVAVGLLSGKTPNKVA